MDAAHSNIINYCNFIHNIVILLDFEARALMIQALTVTKECISLSLYMKSTQSVSPLSFTSPCIVFLLLPPQILLYLKDVAGIKRP